MPLFHHKKIYNVSSGFDEYGHPVIYDSAQDADCKVSRLHEVLYLGSTGSQFIDSGISVNSANGFQLRFQVTEFVNSDMFGGGQSYDKGLGILTRGSGSRLGLVCGTTQYNTGSSDGNIHTFAIKQNTFYVDGEAVGTSSTSASYSNINMFLFKHSSSSPGNFIHYRIYYCKLFDSQLNLLRDFVPALDNSNVPCMYDRVSKEFYYNGGSGTFQYQEKI